MGEIIKFVYVMLIYIFMFTVATESKFVLKIKKIKFFYLILYIMFHCILLTILFYYLAL